MGEAAEGAVGIDLAKELMPDVVLMDVRMPGLGGIEATEIITSTLPDTRVIVLTTLDDESARRRAGAAGATDYLVKGKVRWCGQHAVHFRESPRPVPRPPLHPVPPGVRYREP